MPLDQARSAAPEVLVAVARGDGPLQRQVEDQLRAAIRAGRLVAGERLPSSRALAADLGVSRATLHRRAGNRETLLGEALWLLSDRALSNAERTWDEGRAPQGTVRSLWVMGRFRAAVAAASGMRRLLDEEPALTIRVLTDPRGAVQPRIVAACAALLAHDAEAGVFTPLIDVGSLSYATVRLAESFLYADVIAARAPDLEAADTLISALVLGGAPPREGTPAGSRRQRTPD